MKTSTKFFVFFFLLTIGNIAFAGYSTGKVNAYWVDKTGVFIFEINAAKTQRISCDTSGGTHGRFAVSTNTQQGKDFKDAIINAKNANLDVTAVGDNTCTIRGDSEDIQWIGVAGTSAMVGPKGPKGDTGLQGATGATGPKGPIGMTGPQGPVGPMGPATKSVATCASGSVEYSGAVRNGDCSCSGVTISKVTASNSSCNVTSETGSCSAGVTGYVSLGVAYASCCVCRPV
jgi:hypothetical protein